MTSQIGVINYATLTDELKEDYICNTVCKLGDEKYSSPRDTAVLDLFSMGETVSALEYVHEVEQASETKTDLSADIDAAVVVLPVEADAFDLLSVNSYILIGEEKMVVKSLNEGAGTIEVYGRGYGRSTAAAHVAAEERIILLGRVEKTCENIEECEVFLSQGNIINAVQRQSWCTSWCDEDLCMRTKHMDSCKTEKFLADYKDEAVIKSRVKGLKLMDRVALLGTYSPHTNAEGTAGSTTGIRELAYGIQTVDNSETISGIKFDAQNVADNVCFDNSTPETIAASSAISYDLLQAYFDKVDDVEGFHDVAIMNSKTRRGIRDIILTCQEECVAKGSAAEQNAFRNVSYIDAPFGRIEIVVDNNAKDGEIIFAARRNLKMHPYCAFEGQIFNRKVFEVTNGSGNWKDRSTSFVAFDAMSNMCDELGVLYNFTITEC